MIPIIAIGAFATNVVENRLTDRVETELTNILRLEAGRIDRELDALTERSELLARGRHLAVYVDDVQAARSGALEGDVLSGDVAGVGPIDPFSPTALDEIAGALVAKAVDSNAPVQAAWLLDPSGATLGTTDRTRTPPVISTPPAGPTFLSAYRAAPGDERLPVASPVITLDGRVVGTLVLDHALSPIVDLVVTHERFGETSEAHIAQPTADGDAAFITLLRFAREAAFTKVVPAEMGLPINQSLQSPSPTVVHSPDYRQEPSILAFQTLEQTGWGLVVKIDQSEALGVTRYIQHVLLYGLALTLASVGIGWALVLRPLVHRIRQASAAAETIAAGNYDQPIDDASTDEIGDMSRSIDHLARDLRVDIEKRSEAEARLRYQATHDQLTGIANRLFAEGRLHELLHDAAASEDPDQAPATSLLFLDLDGFKLVNDTWGHAIGDEVLIEVANRLVDITPENALTARWGGDEFVIVLPDSAPGQTNTVMRSVRRAFASPFVTSIGEHQVHCSIGGATAGPSTTPDELLHQADGRMFSEKQEDRRSRLVSTATARLVEAALAEHRFEAWLQPIVELDHNDAQVRIVGAEALVRIRLADGTIVQPPDFLPELQNSRFARQIDLRVAELAMTQLASWNRAGLIDDAFSVSINLSPASLNHDNLVAELTSRVRRFATPPTSIILEISEELAELNQTLIDDLRAAGFQIAIDDLGLKHSNIDRLTSSGATIAKIDRLFSDDAAVLSGLFHTCDAKGVQVIAEGVETAAQASAMRSLGITHAQGFYFGRPQPGAMFEGMLTRQANTIDASWS